MKQWIVTPRQRCDLELLLTGGFAPLAGFLCEEDYASVLDTRRLSNGALWPMPIVLDVTDEFAATLEKGRTFLLSDSDNTPLAEITVDSIWQPEKTKEALAVYGTRDLAHPGVDYLFNRTHGWYVGGILKAVNVPSHYDFMAYRRTPAQLKEQFKSLGWDRVVGFQTRNPMHRAHMELTLRAGKAINGGILIHPVVGQTKPGDVDHFTRVRCYEQLMSQYPKNTALLSLLPLAMRMAGPVEALWHGLIRKNYGCTHFIVGRDHAGPGNDSNNKPFYGAYDAQALMERHEADMGITMVPFEEMVYAKERKVYCPRSELQPNETPCTVSGTELRAALRENKEVPSWFSFPEVMKELRYAYPPKNQQGFTLFFTGLSGAGKSTIAQGVLARLMSEDRRKITLLDGDVVRRHLASELGFSKAHRDLNIQRMGFVASEVTKAGGIVICAAIAPYAKAREMNRQLISGHGGYIEIYVATPLDTCIQRDTKGLYAKALAGEIQGFTGVDDPYEAPEKADMVLDTTHLSMEAAVDAIMEHLIKLGYLQKQSSISHTLESAKEDLMVSE